jgi:release factor glutamine methyltransferase
MFKREKTLSELRKEAINQFADSFSDREKKQMVKGLILEYMSLSNNELLLNPNIVVSPLIVEKVETSIKKMNNGAPYQYVVGNSFFYDNEFKIDKRALIPRPETEELVHRIIELKRGQESTNWRVLDVGTGSGCIAISLKLALPNCYVYGIDISKGAVDLAIENATALNADVTFKQKDIFEESVSNEKFDMIVSNPPYIPLKEKLLMKSHVTEFEPSEALFVENDDPIMFYARIADVGLELLKNSGYLAFEIHENLAENVKNCLFLKGYKNISIHEDLQGKDRMIFAQLLDG